MQGKCMRAGEAYAAEVYAGEVCGTEEMTHGFVRNLGLSLRIVVPFYADWQRELCVGDATFERLLPDYEIPRVPKRADNM